MYSIIIGRHKEGHLVFQNFVSDRICGDKNLWERMTKVKFKNWDEGCKNIKIKVGSKQVNVKAANSLFARLLLIDLQEMKLI